MINGTQTSEISKISEIFRETHDLKIVAIQKSNFIKSGFYRENELVLECNAFGVLRLYIFSDIFLFKFCQKLSAYEKNRNEQSFDEKKFNASISGWKGHACQANTYRLRSALEEKFATLEMDLVDFY